jgi:hypothetical protein
LSHIYCPECGFQNPEAANYCSKCGALLVKEEPGSETTQSFTPEEGDEDAVPTLEELGAEGPALVVRSGGGRAEHFVPQGGRTTGRSPDCDLIFWTTSPSRAHAVLGARVLHRGPGSLAAPSSRRRIESGRLENSDRLRSARTS